MPERKPRKRGVKSTPPMSPFTRQVGSWGEEVSATRKRLIIDFPVTKYGDLVAARVEARRVCTAFANFRAMERRRADRRQDEKVEARLQFTPCYDVVCTMYPKPNKLGFEVHFYHQDELADMFIVQREHGASVLVEEECEDDAPRVFTVADILGEHRLATEELTHYEVEKSVEDEIMEDENPFATGEAILNGEGEG